jgi:hypothetical protein
MGKYRSSVSKIISVHETYLWIVMFRSLAPIVRHRIEEHVAHRVKLHCSYGTPALMHLEGCQAVSSAVRDVWSWAKWSGVRGGVVCVRCVELRGGEQVRGR